LARILNFSRMSLCLFSSNEYLSISRESSSLSCLLASISFLIVRSFSETLTSFISYEWSSCSRLSIFYLNCFSLFNFSFLCSYYSTCFLIASFSAFCFSITRFRDSTSISSSLTDLELFDLSLTESPEASFFDCGATPKRVAAVAPDFSAISDWARSSLALRTEEYFDEASLYCSRSVILF